MEKKPITTLKLSDTVRLSFFDDLVEVNDGDREYQCWYMDWLYGDLTAVGLAELQIHNNGTIELREGTRYAAPGWWGRQEDRVVVRTFKVRKSQINRVYAKLEPYFVQPRQARLAVKDDQLVLTIIGDGRDGEETIEFSSNPGVYWKPGTIEIFADDDDNNVVCGLRINTDDQTLAGQRMTPPSRFSFSGKVSKRVIAWVKTNLLKRRILKAVADVPDLTKHTDRDFTKSYQFGELKLLFFQNSVQVVHPNLVSESLAYINVVEGNTLTAQGRTATLYIEKGKSVLHVEMQYVLNKPTSAEIEFNLPDEDVDMITAMACLQHLPQAPFDLELSALDKRRLLVRVLDRRDSYVLLFGRFYELDEVNVSTDDYITFYFASKEYPGVRVRITYDAVDPRKWTMEYNHRLVIDGIKYWGVDLLPIADQLGVIKKLVKSL